MSFYHIYYILLGIFHALPFIFIDSFLSVIFGWIFCLLLASLTLSHKKISIFGITISGVIFNLLAFPWLIDTFKIYTNFSYFSSLALFIIFSIISALPFTIFGIFFRFLSPKTPISIALITPALWTLVHIIFSPWSKTTIANSQNLFLHFVQIADIGGISLVMFIMINLSFTILFLIRNFNIDKKFSLNPIKFNLPTLFIFSFSLIYGFHQIKRFSSDDVNIAKYNIGVIQLNNKPQKVYSPEHRDRTILEYQNLSNELISNYNVDLLVWPESSVLRAYDFELKYFSPGADEDPFPGLNIPLFFGTTLYKSLYNDELYFNGALLRNKNGAVGGSHVKTHLFPFSEYMPFENFIPSFIRGLLPKIAYPKNKNLDSPKPILVNDNLAIDAFICYDDLWSKNLSQNCKNNNIPSIFISLSNDSWFGESIASRQHDHLAGIRAIEHRRDMVRATVNGVSSWTRASGEKLKELPKSEVSYEVFKGVRAYSINTIYSCYGKLVNFLIILIFTIFGMFTNSKKLSKK